MAITYEPIATTTLGSAVASYTFSSIPGTYTDLVLVTSLVMTAGSPESKIRFNSNTATNYNYTILYGTGSTVASLSVISATGIDTSYYGVPNTTAGASVQITNILSYANTTTYKVALSRANNSALGVDAIAGVWRSTAAITSLTAYPNSSTFASGSVLTLFGIKAA